MMLWIKMNAIDQEKPGLACCINKYLLIQWINEWISVLKDTSEKTQSLLHYNKIWELGFLTKTQISRLLSLLEILIYFVNREYGVCIFHQCLGGSCSKFWENYVMEFSLIKALLTLWWRRVRFSNGKSLSIRMSMFFSLVKLLIVNKINANCL